MNLELVSLRAEEGQLQESALDQLVVKNLMNK